MKKRFFFIFLISLTLYGAQNRIGAPFINIYSLEEYRGGMQNWAIIQDGRGILYVANNDGLLEFDGTSWRLMRMPNRSVVRSLAVDDSGTIYVGAVGEMGFLRADEMGRTRFVSLLERIPLEYRKFNEVWETLATPEGILFRTNFALYLWHDGKMTVMERRGKNQFNKSFFVNGSVYVRELGNGLLRLRDSQLAPVEGSGALGQDLVIVMLPRDAQSILMVTRERGLFLFHPDRKKGPVLEKMTGCQETDRLLVKNIIYCGTRIDEQRVALGTLQNGLAVINTAGELLQHYNLGRGLPDDTVYAVYRDVHKNIWLGTSNGIIHMETGSPFSRLDSKQQVFGNGFAAHLAADPAAPGRQVLFLGTSRGVYYRDLLDWRSPFRSMDVTQGQVWKLAMVKDTLLCGYTFGVLQIDPLRKAATPVLTSTNNIHIFKFLSLARYPDYLLGCGLYGFHVFRYEKKGWRYLGMVDNFPRSARYSEEDRYGNIWVGHENIGIQRLRLSASLEWAEGVTFFSARDGLPFDYGNRVYKLGDEVVFGTERGLYRFDDKTERFVPHAELNRFFRKDGPLFPFSVDGDGSIWFQEGREKGVLRRGPDGKYTPDWTPFPLIGWGRIEAAILPLDRENILFGVSDGFVHYNPAIRELYESDFRTLIRRVEFSRAKEELFGGTFRDGRGRFVPDQPDNDMPMLPFRKNAVRIHFSAVYFQHLSDNFYSNFLSGFDTGWSPWGKDTSREYINLPPGRYTFQVKARNIFGRESLPAAYRFVISTPWYRSGWAWAGYALAMILVVAAIVRWRTKYLEKEKNQLEGLVSLRTQELQQKSEELKEMSLSDPLTNLRNRRFVSEILSEEVASFVKQRKYLLHHQHRRRAIAGNAVFGVLLCDIDHFKAVNDQYGHRAGDLFLKQFAEILRSFVRKDDAVVRWGGEEFLVVLKKTDPANLPRLAEKIRKKMNESTFVVSDTDTPLSGHSCSVGIAFFPFIDSEPDLVSFEHIIMLADKALYFAKERGRNRSMLVEHAGGVPPKEEVHRVVQAFSPGNPGEFARVREFM